VPSRFREQQWSLLPNGETSAAFIELVKRLLAGGAAPAGPVAPSGKSEAPGKLPKAKEKKQGLPPRGASDVSGQGDAGFWVAVLPFKCGGAGADLVAVAEGLTEDIVTGLSRFSYLRVIARSSTERYAHDSLDVRSAGRELGARYVMEGSLRRAGSKLRIAVQLVDASSGAHLWAETYNRSFSSEEVFELQDDLVPRIVSTVADMYGVLPHTMSEALRSKGPDELSPYEAMLRSFGYYERLTVEEHAAARTGLERAVEEAPGHADCWAMLSMIYGEEYKFGYNLRPDPLGRALRAAQRAAEAAPSNHFAYLALAQTLFFRREFPAFRNAAERALALNPMDGFTFAHMGLLIGCNGDWDRGVALSERAAQLNPNFPGWYWFPAFYNAYRKKDYHGALSVAIRINVPGFFWTHVVLAAAHGQLGEREAAAEAVRALQAFRPDFAEVARAELRKWNDPELVEHLLEGLRKAGLEVGANTAR
jgi:TolB-like protein